MATSSLPPQPVYIFRGHGAPIHALQFFRSNLRLLTGDADGWVVVWSTTTKRPVAVWRAHDHAILGLDAWGPASIITHGRDGKLHVWQFLEELESTMDARLPVDDPTAHRKQPWLAHSLDVNTTNFCAFTWCYAPTSISAGAPDRSTVSRPILVAVPSTSDSDGIDVIQLPLGQVVATVPSQKDLKTGMVMSLRIWTTDGQLLLAAGYESGHVVLLSQAVDRGTWVQTSASKTHSQPVLAVDVCEGKFVLSSSADSTIARYPVTPVADDSAPPAAKEINTRHAGQQGLRVRNDEKIFATAGWDSRVRVYSSQTLKELAVLKWHKDGCYAVAFASMPSREGDDELEGRVGDMTDVKDLQNVDLQLSRVERRRRESARSTHWLAAGSKDGKVSLWEIY